MAFRQKPPPETRPSSPRELYRLLPRRPFPSLWGHQERILDNYFNTHQTNRHKDIALELPTGSGKTLVGLLIGEYQRRISKARVVYLCSTNQLVHQTQARADEYGIPATTFVGSKKNYCEADIARFQSGGCIAITSYASIFNNGPGLEEPQVIICDDAHSGENYVAKMWSLRVSAFGEEKPLFQSLVSFFGDLISPTIRNVAGSAGFRDVDLIPTPAFADRVEQLEELLNEHCFKSSSDLKWSWIALKGHLKACCVFVSPSAFLIRPLIPPTHIHAPFANAEHRVYMSATLGEDGDLERMFGIKKVERIHADDLRDANTGRRFIMFPGMMQEDGRKHVF